MPETKLKIHLICHSPFLKHSYYIYKFFYHPDFEMSFTFLMHLPWASIKRKSQMRYMVGESSSIKELRKAKSKNFDYIFYLGCPARFTHNPIPRFVKVCSRQDWILKPLVYRRYKLWKTNLSDIFLPPKVGYQELADFLWQFYPYYYRKEPKDKVYLKVATRIFFTSKRIFDQLEIGPQMEEEFERFDLRVCFDTLIERWNLPGFVQGIESWKKFWSMKSYKK